MAEALELAETTACSYANSVLDEVFAGIEVLADQAAALHARASAENRKPTTTELATIRSTVLAHLGGEHPKLAGTGVIAAPDSLADEPRWLEWWRTSADSDQPQQLTPDLDPNHVDGYVYTAAPWFETPRATGGRVIVGPYVDYAGTDEYILTFADPVHVGDRFVGVAAADIRTTDLEERLLPLLSDAGSQLLLVNAYGRIIASNTPAAIVGCLVNQEQSSGEHVPIGTAWADSCTGLPWSLIRK